MKLQHLSIIFIIIMIPILLIVSYYIGLQIDTINKQTAYDTKLQEAAGEAIAALEINTVEWNPKFSGLADSKRRDVEASINTFIDSIANKMGVGGQAKEYTLAYLPAIVYTLYDGYYVYANGDIPNVIVDNDGQAQKLENGQLQENGTVYEHTLQSFTPYSETLTNGTTGESITINYTLDNFARVYGLVDENVGGTIQKKAVNYEGYLSAIASSNSEDEIGVWVQGNSGDIDLAEVRLNGKDLKDGEYLTEKIHYIVNVPDPLDSTKTITKEDTKPFIYIYDGNNTKYYYNNAGDKSIVYPDDTTNEYDNKFFYLDSDDNVVWVKNLLTNKPLKRLVLLDNSNNTKVYYQSLEDYNKFYNEDGTLILEDTLEHISMLTTLRSKYNDLTIDYSGRNYCVESYAFTTWFNKFIGNNGNNGKDWNSNIVFNKDADGDPIYETISADTFYITKDNNPDPERDGNVIKAIYGSMDSDEEYYNSEFTIHKMAVMRNSIENNLKRVVAYANKNLVGATYEYRLPELKETDWDRLLSNISILGFLQGVPTGLKYYNNYTIVSSSNNNEYVDPKAIYLSSDNDVYYHRRGCDKLTSGNVSGYRSTDYIEKKVEKEGTEDTFYYMHEDGGNSGLGCYYCMVDQNKKANSPAYEQEYYTALARERYIAQQHLTPSVVIPVIPITHVYRYRIVYIDESGNPISNFAPVETSSSSKTIGPGDIDATYNSAGIDYTIVPGQLSKTKALKEITESDIVEFEFSYKKENPIITPGTLTMTVASIHDHDSTVDGNITTSEKGFIITVTGGSGNYTYYRDGDEITLEPGNKDFTRFGEHHYSVIDTVGNTGTSQPVYDWTISEQEDFEILRNSYVNNGKLAGLLEDLPSKIDVIDDNFNVNLGTNLIGTKSHEFSKTLEGNNHTIEVSGGGLFGYNKGTIQNLNINASIEGTGNVGGVTSVNEGTIQNVHILSGKVKGTVNKIDSIRTEENEGIGGIAGLNSGYYTDSTKSQWIQAKILRCSNKAEVECNANGGGIAGVNYGAIIDECFNGEYVHNCDNENVYEGDDELNNRIGGIAGVNGGKGKTEYIKIEGYWEHVWGPIYKYVSGKEELNISVQATASISNCYNTGIIQGKIIRRRDIGTSEKEDDGNSKNAYRYSRIGVGGIVGVCDDVPIDVDMEITLFNKYRAKLTEWGEDIENYIQNRGKSMWTISKCYNAGQIKGGRRANAADRVATYHSCNGGIVGYNYTKNKYKAVSNSFYLEDTAKGAMSSKNEKHDLISKRTYNFGDVTRFQLINTHKDYNFEIAVQDIFAGRAGEWDFLYIDIWLGIHVHYIDEYLTTDIYNYDKVNYPTLVNNHGIAE